MGRMRPTLTVSSATAFAEANARTARAVSALHIRLSSNLFDISVAHGGASPLLVPARSRDRRGSPPPKICPIEKAPPPFSPPSPPAAPPPRGLSPPLFFFGTAARPTPFFSTLSRLCPQP